MEIDSPKRWLYHITHPDDTIAVHVMAFLTTLLLNGNENSQNKLYDIIEEDNDFFTRLHRVIKSVIISFSSSVKFVLTSSDFKVNKHMFVYLCLIHSNLRHLKEQDHFT
jgi:hypothetical protein